MRPQTALPEGTGEALEPLLREAKSKLEFQRVQCIWLRMLFHFSAEQVARAIGWHPLSVRKLQAQYLQRGNSILKVAKKGGRYRENMSLEEESTLLSSFLNRAERGAMLVVKEIHTAYQESVGHPVSLSTTYRMLARHGWRKIAPRPHHPKTNTVVQEEFKKNSPGSSRKKQ